MDQHIAVQISLGNGGECGISLLCDQITNIAIIKCGNGASLIPFEEVMDAGDYFLVRIARFSQSCALKVDSSIVVRTAVGGLDFCPIFLRTLIVNIGKGRSTIQGITGKIIK